MGLVVPFSDVIISLALSHLETWTLFLRAPCSGRHLPLCSCDSLRRLLEEHLSVFYVKAHTNPEVDLPFAIENLELILRAPCILPRMRQFGGMWTYFTHFLCDGELRSMATSCWPSRAPMHN